MANSDRAFSLADAVRKAVGDKPMEITGQVVEIPREQIKPNPANFYHMEAHELESLATSIQLTGLIHPIIVRPDEAGTYVITDGERRYRATGILHETGSDEDKKRWATIPAIVRTPVNAVLEELALIEANRQSRKLTDAELSKQAERLQELLVALKASGVAIPGRIRSAVSEAMQLSESKLARLKKIRADLAPEYLAMFDVGQLNESVSYELAKLPVDRQRLIAGPPDAGGPYNIGKKTLDQVKELVQYAAGAIRGRECPRGVTCLHETAMFNHDKGQRYSWNRECELVSCCAKCTRLTTCKDVCPMCKGDATAEKKKAAERKAAEQAKTQRENEEKKAAADICWARLKSLREAAGIAPNDPRLYVYPGIDDYDRKERRDPEVAGVIFPGDYTPCHTLLYYADLFGVSLDALVGRETPAQQREGITWHLTAEVPPPAGKTVIFWGTRGLRTPPAAAVSNYISAWPDEYAWWTTVDPPPTITVQQPEQQGGGDNAE